MTHITVEELKARLNNGEQLHIIDVREPNEYAEYNIGAKLIPLGKIMGLQLDELEDWKDDEIIIHCRSGARSQQAALMLEQAGFKNVVNVTGGALAWQAKFGNDKI
jgi:rhodanese-related sulfurtransferase